MNTKYSRLLVVITTLGVLLSARVAFAVSVDEIITLSRLGIAEEEIIKAITKDRTVFSLAIEDIVKLRKEGVKQDVIRFMMKTPDEFGGGAAAGAGTGAATMGATPAAGASTQPVVEEKPKSLAEIQAENERSKQEALKLAEERKAAEEAKKKAYTQGELAKGMEAVEEGDWVAAVLTFQSFMQKGDYGPGTDEYYTARYGIASAFMKAELYHSAGKFLLEVLSEGPQKQFFQAAFMDLRELRAKVDYAPPMLEELTKHFVGGFSTSFQDEYYYFLGKFFYDYSNFPMAIKFLQLVNNKSHYFPRAKYLIGLVQVTNTMYRSALKSFQESIISAETFGSDLSDVVDLAYLALARIAYENGEYDAAIYYYRKVPKTSRLLQRAFYESAWTFFLKGDPSRAIGTFHALHSPYFDRYFYPELWILEATVFLNMCQYELARDALNMFGREVVALDQPLKEFLSQIRMPADYYRAFKSVVNGTTKEYSLPKKLQYAVLGDPEFNNLYRALSALEAEIKEVESALDKLGPFGKQLVMKLQAAKMGRVNEVGIKIQQILKGVQIDIRNYQIKVTEIEVDLGGVEIAKLDEKTRDIMARQEKERVSGKLLLLIKRKGTPEQVAKYIKRNPIFREFSPAEIQKLEDSEAPVVPAEVIAHLRALTSKGRDESGVLAIVGADALMWPWEGDFWIDEIGSYRSFLKEVCAK